MGQYNKVLAAIDLGDQSKKVNEMVKSYVEAGVEVHICSAIVPLEAMYSFSPVGGYAMAVGGFQEELIQHARRGLDAFAESLGIKPEAAHLLVGRSASEIKTLAEDGSFDLILVGTHGKNAVKAMLGSVSNGVLHGAPCDVLAIKYETS